MGETGVTEKGKQKKGYRSVPLSAARRMLMAAVDCNTKNAIHCITEIDVSQPLKLIREHAEYSGEKLSFTAYIVKCFAQAIEEHPEMNAFIKGRKLIVLDDINISVMVERDLGPEKIPEPVGIQKIQDKSLGQVHREIRHAQNVKGARQGELTGSTWINRIPRFLMRSFIRIADKNIYMARRYGKIAVTAVGMFSDSPMWFIPHGTATVMLTVGSINSKIVKEGDEFISREFLCITASFDHKVIDGAPAARFMNTLTEIMREGDLVEKELAKRV